MSTDVIQAGLGVPGAPGARIRQLTASLEADPRAREWAREALREAVAISAGTPLFVREILTLFRKSPREFFLPPSKEAT